MKKYKESIYWTIWLSSVILWNFGYPKASPLADVLIAVFLSLTFIFIKKIKK
jgi:hypothetical protein